MIGGPGALLVGGLLLFLLLLLGTRGVAAARGWSSKSDLPLHDDAAEIVPCPPEFALQIFSRADWEFASAIKSHKIEKLFRSERKAVALLWVRQTSAAIQRVMREHAQATRGSGDLEFTTEVKLVLLYAELMLLCGALFLASQSAGPLWVRGVALYTDSLSQHIADVQQGFSATTARREISSIGSS
jgi:hypothetical protein